jgi:SOS response regulatory protein OraA/RecX
MELRAKQVGDELISIAFEECGIDFAALARSVAFKKFGVELGKALDTKALDTKAVDTEALDAKAVDIEALDTKAVDIDAVDMKVLDMKVRARISRFMQQRGFSYDHISGLY